MTYTSALIVGAGSGLSASLARLFAKNGMRVALAARSTDKLATLAQETKAEPARLRRHRPRASRQAVCRARSGARRRRLQRQLPHARAVHRTRSGRGRQGDRRLGLRRLPGGAGGGQAHAAETPRRHFVHRRFGEREGLRAVGALRHGQVRLARTGAKPGARTVAAGHPCRAFRHRRRHRQRAPAAVAGQSGRAARPRRHRAELSGTSCSSRAAPGAGRSNCGPGWRSSEVPCHARARPAHLDGAGTALPRSAGWPGQVYSRAGQRPDPVARP